jgi:SAM-dependent methyltransferase
MSAAADDQLRATPRAVLPFIRRLARNRFLPTPPAEKMFCGDGDFRAIGAEFLEHFVVRGGLLPHERVLDIGCGIGRMAVPLTQYLDESGCYDGVDIVADGIQWCSSAITAAYPAFRFQHLNLHHPLYNPDATEPTTKVKLPFADGSFDFICMISVLTHLTAEDAAHYAREIGRLLAPGGRCFATTFMMNPPARAALQSGAGALAFDPSQLGPVWYADPGAPLAAVAFDEDVLLEYFLRAGLRRRPGAVYGRWSGLPSGVFQDINVFQRG